MKNSKRKGLSKKDFFAVIWGFVIFCVGDLLLTVLIGAFSFIGFSPAGNLFLFLYAFIIYGFSGWLIIEKSQSKSWYLAAFPLIIVLILKFFGETLHAIILLPWWWGVGVPNVAGNEVLNLGNPLYNYAILFLFQILGGQIAKYRKIDFRATFGNNPLMRVNRIYLFSGLILFGLLVILFMIKPTKICTANVPFQNPSASSLVFAMQKDDNTDVAITWVTNCRLNPTFWLNNAVMKPLAQDEVARSVMSIKSAMKQYPPHLLRERLRKVYLLGDLWTTGRGADGIYAPLEEEHDEGMYRAGFSEIYLVDEGDLTDIELQRIFHHEFSHLLQERYNTSYNETDWEALNSEDFTYDYVGSSQEITEESLQDGFLNEYSKTNVREEMSEFAELLFTNNEKFWRIVEINKIIRKKTDLVIAFYHAIDPIFTEKYFRNLPRESE